MVVSVETLEKQIGQTFRKEKNHTITEVVLRDVGKRAVTVGFKDRIDTQRIPVAEFVKFYRAV